MKRIAASIMCADPLSLGEELEKLESAGVKMLHCDVMDGKFVNNLAMAPYVIEAIKAQTDMLLDIHLATREPIHYVDLFAPVHPEYISFHVEVVDRPHHVIEHIRGLGIKPVIAVSPRTIIERVYPYLDEVDMVLIMTVNPGFSGQKFQSQVINKIIRLKKYTAGGRKQPLIEVDGNIYDKTARETALAGADVFVVGTAALFNDYSQSYSEKLEKIRRAIG